MVHLPVSMSTGPVASVAKGVGRKCVGGTRTFSLLLFIFEYYKFKKSTHNVQHISTVTTVNIKSPSDVMGQIKLLNLIKNGNGKRCASLSSNTKWT